MRQKEIKLGEKYRYTIIVGNVSIINSTSTSNLQI